MKRAFLASIILAALTLAVSAQDISFPELEGFKKSTQFPVYTNSDLWSYIDGAADGYVSLGFSDLHIAEYKKGKDIIKAEIYHHGDHILAFGIYASERSATYRFVNLGAQGYVTGGAINFFKGNYYVKLRTYSEKPKTLHAEEVLASRIADLIGGETSMPAMLSKFPAENRKINEETFVNESVLGHDFLKKAYKADYTYGSDNFSIYLISSASPQEAQKLAKTYVTSAGMEPDEGASSKYVITDGYNGTIFLTCNDDMLVIIAGLAKDQADIAAKYTAEILK